MRQLTNRRCTEVGIIPELLEQLDDLAVRIAVRLILQ